MSGASLDVACVGAATEDAIALVDRLPGPDERVEAIDTVMAGGGPAATAAVALARQGARVAFIGAIGDDEVGDRIRSGLTAEGIDTSGLVVRDGARSGMSLVLVDRAAHGRAIVNRRPPPLVMTSAGTALCRRARWIHVDQAGLPAIAEADLMRPGAGPRPQVSIDAGNPISGLDLRGIDLFGPTEQSLLDRYPGHGVMEAMRRARADGAEAVVVTCGPRGSAGLDACGSVEAPGYAVDVRSTLGAGDVFHGALLAALIAGRTLADALQRANAAAALSCAALDGRSAIPRAGELDAFVRARER